LAILHKTGLDRADHRTTRAGAAGRGWIAFAAASGGLSVIVGAFAAHGFDPATQAAQIGWLHTGSQYQSLHALAMLATAILAHHGLIGDRPARATQWLFLVGNILFPAALYGLAFQMPRWLGAVAPIGGTAYILGWLVLAAAAFTARNKAGAIS
jgi:uncharacterized membrane protein YgdD (TMEM256/DUF423 family)